MHEAQWLCMVACVLSSILMPASLPVWLQYSLFVYSFSHTPCLFLFTLLSVYLLFSLLTVHLDSNPVATVMAHLDSN